MSGVKGRSGKLTTAEQKASASERGKKGMAVRWGTPPAIPPPTVTNPASDDPVERLGKPVTWGDELKRQQVEGERIQNRRRSVEVQRAEVELEESRAKRDLARGDSLTKQRHLDLVREILDRVLSHLPLLTDAALSQHPPERQPLVRHALSQAEAKFREAAMAAIKGS